MKLCEPDWRWNQILNAQDKDVSPIDDYCVYALKVIKKETTDPFLSGALLLIEDTEYRDYIIAFLLSGAPLTTIHSSLEVNPGELDHFIKLRFDMSTFRHKMEKRRYAAYFIDKVCKTKEVKTLLPKSIIEGPVALELFWNNAQQKLTPSSTDMYRSLVEMVYTKAVAVRHSSLTGRDAQEGLKWINSAIKALSTQQQCHFAGRPR
jgi:hypothetical protein